MSTEPSSSNPRTPPHTTTLKRQIPSASSSLSGSPRSPPRPAKLPKCSHEPGKVYDPMGDEVVGAPGYFCDILTELKKGFPELDVRFARFRDKLYLIWPPGENPIAEERAQRHKIIDELIARKRLEDSAFKDVITKRHGYKWWAETYDAELAKEAGTRGVTQQAAEFEQLMGEGPRVSPPQTIGELQSPFLLRLFENLLVPTAEILPLSARRNPIVTNEYGERYLVAGLQLEWENVLPPHELRSLLIVEDEFELDVEVVSLPDTIIVLGVKKLFERPYRRLRPFGSGLDALCWLTIFLLWCPRCQKFLAVDQQTLESYLSLLHTCGNLFSAVDQSVYQHVRDVWKNGYRRFVGQKLYLDLKEKWVMEASIGARVNELGVTVVKKADELSTQVEELGAKVDEMREKVEVVRRWVGSARVIG